jgi:hypothetical protein
MYTLSGTTVSAIRGAAAKNDLNLIFENVDTALLLAGRKKREGLKGNINILLTDISIEKNNPAILRTLQGISHDDTNVLLNRIIQHYIITHEEDWLTEIFSLVSMFRTKSQQSEAFAMLAHRLIETGITTSDPALVQQGIGTLDRITLVKYRSNIIEKVIPMLIAWAVGSGDYEFLEKTSLIIRDIGDSAKRSVAQTNLVCAIATLSIRDRNLSKFIGSIRFACTIKQKNQRQTCIASVITSGSSQFLQTPHDNVCAFIDFFAKEPDEIRSEIICALLEDLYDRSNDHTTIRTCLNTFAQEAPFSLSLIVLTLLDKAKKDGDVWYLVTALHFHDLFLEKSKYPIQDLVRTGSAIAGTTKDSHVLMMIVPLVAASCDPVESSRLYLKIARVLLSIDKDKDAVKVLEKISCGMQNQQSFDECCSILCRQTVLSDNVALARDFFEKRADRIRIPDILSRSVHDLCRNFSFGMIIRHIESFLALILLHPKKDHLVLECIVTLLKRGFLQTNDPDVLISCTKVIGDPSQKEQALSTIVIEVAKMGVHTRSRDLLQRAVGLTCLIEGEKTRSATLTTIIDEATELAVHDGDLDLLRRMREWSASLLSRDIETLAIARITEGMIKYAIDTQHPGALEEAYLIAQDIDDPSLKKELIDHICECFVKIGCLVIHTIGFSVQDEDFTTMFQPFQRARELLILHGKKEERSLKVSHFIDIILESARQKSLQGFFFPLCLYVLEIENPIERNAMVSRIVANIKQHILTPESTDPYETLVYNLLSIKYPDHNPLLTDLVVRVAGEIKDPFTRLFWLLNASQNYLRANDRKKSKEILQQIRSSLQSVPLKYQKVILLAGLIESYRGISESLAKKCLDDAVHLLPDVEYDHRSTAHKQVVFAIARFYENQKNTIHIEDALKVASAIDDPSDYIISMIAIFRMIQHDPHKKEAILSHIEKKCDGITLPAEKALVLLDFISLFDGTNDHDYILKLLDRIARITPSIDSIFIADMVKKSIVQQYLNLLTDHYNKQIAKKANDIAETIEYDLIRDKLRNPDGQIDIKCSPTYEKIKNLTNQMNAPESNSGYRESLEKTVQSVPDRIKRTQYYATMYILLMERTHQKNAKHFMQAAMGEAGKIRPLSRRSMVLCDIAMLWHSAGHYDEAQTLMDDAVDATANIRQYEKRDAAFERLSCVITFLRDRYP